MFRLSGLGFIVLESSKTLPLCKDLNMSNDMRDRSRANVRVGANKIVTWRVNQFLVTCSPHKFGLEQQKLGINAYLGK